MSIFRKLGIVKAYYDLINYLDWVKIIKREENDPDSKFNSYKLKRTKLYDVYYIVNLPEEDSILTDSVKRIKVVESLNHINRYFDDDLGFANDLSIEFNQIEDNENLLMSYLIVYSFAMNKLSLKWILKYILGLTLFIYTLSYKNDIYEWILNLIR